MSARAPHARQPLRRTRPQRRGTILVVVLLIIVALTGMVLVLGRSARVEAFASINHVAVARATSVERAAEQYVVALLAQQRQEVMTLEESYFAQVPVGEAGAFWIMRPDYGDSSMPTYGLVDEASKLNLVSATRDQLRALRVMPQELPDTVFDWKDEDANVEFEGAEDEYYLNLPTPYRCKNANFETVEELLFVKGAYPELLHGDGVSGTLAGRAAGVGGGMQIGGLSDQDLLARGLFNYLTVYSREPNPNGRGTRVGRVNVNTAPREVLRCLPGVTDADVSTIVSRREGNGFGNPGTEWVREALGERYGPIAQYITGESYQFSADIVAVSGDGRAFRRVRVVVDARDPANRPRVLYRRDLTDRGWPLEPALLESMRAGSWSPTQTPGMSRF